MLTERYLTRLAGLLPQGVPRRERYLGDLAIQARQLREEHPYTAILTLRRRFGSPERAAESFLEESGEAAGAERLRLRRRNRRFRTIVALLLACVVSVLLYWTVRTNAAINGRIETEIINTNEKSEVKE